MKRWSVFLAVLSLCVLPVVTRADLTLVGEVELGGQGFGAGLINIETGHDTGSTPHPDIESACIDAGTGNLGKQGATCVREASRATMNLIPFPMSSTTPRRSRNWACPSRARSARSSTSPSPAATSWSSRTAISTCSSSKAVGYFNAFYDGPTLNLTEQGTGTAGFGFKLDDAQGALADAHCAAGTSECKVGAGFEVTEFKGATRPSRRCNS